MKALSAYILSVTAAAILLGILQSLTDKKTSISALIRLIGGVFLAFTVIAPITDIEFDLLFDIPLSFTQDGTSITIQGYNESQQQLRNSIKQQCEAYILDKTMSYQTSLEIDVVLNDADLPVPVSAQLRGDISPYAKKALQSMLANDIGISEENQIWIE